MKLASILSVVLLVFWVFIAIIELWFDIFSFELFVKITVTILLIIVLAVGVALVKREYVDEEKMKKDKYLD